MKYIILSILLTACSSSNSPEVTVVNANCEGTAYYGDSIGRQLRDSGLLPEIDFHVVSGVTITGRTASGVNSPIIIDGSYCTIFIALGTNQAWPVGGRSTADITKDSLLTMIEGIEDRVTCVLPMTIDGELIEPSRSTLKQHCPRYIDPIQLGVYPLSSDGVHLERGENSENIAHYASMFL